MHKSLYLTADKFNVDFLSAEKDMFSILNKLFVESKPYSDDLKRLLVLPTKDCLDDLDSKVYQDTLKEMTIKKMCEDGYIRNFPKINMGEHEDVKTYIIMSFDNYMPNFSNPQFCDCTVAFEILSHPDTWDLGNFRIRPLKIAGYIKGILDKQRLSGIGTFQFIGCKQLVLDEELAGYTIMFKAIHGTDDKLQ